MSAIFISYRSKDYDRGVAVLHSHLVNTYGAENITLDKSTFAPGSPWLPQILSGVAMSEIILCVLGHSWTTTHAPAQEGEVDFVVEELTLARKMGKLILPVILNEELEKIREALPESLAWLADLQFARFDPTADVDIAGIEASIMKIGGPRAPKSNAQRGALLMSGDLTISRVARNILGSVLRPTSYAASALKPTYSSLWQTLFQAAAALLLLCVDGMLVVGELNAFMIFRWGGSIAVVSLLAYLSFMALTRFVKAPPPALSLANISIHLAAALSIVLALWIWFFWVATPDVVQAKFTSMVDSEIPIQQQLEALAASITLTTALILDMVAIGAVAHVLFVLFGTARAGAIALGWRRWTLALPISGLGLVFVALIWWLLTYNPGVQEEKLPIKLKLEWKLDRLETDGLKKGPFLFAVSGTIEKREETISFHIDRLNAENRGQPTIQVQSLMCALGMLKAGQFEYPELIPQGRAEIRRQLPTDQSFALQNLTVNIPLGTIFHSGETALQCYVEHPGGSYPVGNGRFVILRW